MNMLQKLSSFLAVLFLTVVMSCQAWSAGDAVHVKLLNTTGEKVDYYQGGSAPKFISSIDVGGKLDVQVAPGQVLLFGINRKLFQKYTVRSEAYQELGLAPAGKQKSPKLSNVDPDMASTDGGDSGQEADAADAETPAVTKTPSKPKTKPAPVTESEQGGAGAGGSDEGLVWQYFAVTKVAAISGKVHQLVYGIPETDAVKFMGSCGVDPKSRLMRFDFSADVAKSKNGAPVKIDLMGLGLSKTLNGSVIRSDSGEGLEGYRVALLPDDPDVVKLTTLNQVKYGLQGKARTVLDLAQGHQTIRKFLLLCSQRQGVQVTSAESKSAGASQSITCAAAEKLKSPKTGALFNVTFKNMSSEYRHIDVKNPSGQLIDNGGVDPGASMKISLRAGHVVMFSDGPGNCIEAAVVKDGVTSYKMTKRSPGFGDGND
jgi:hypothetical protein